MLVLSPLGCTLVYRWWGHYAHSMLLFAAEDKTVKSWEFEDKLNWASPNCLGGSGQQLNNTYCSSNYQPRCCHQQLTTVPSAAWSLNSWVCPSTRHPWAIHHMFQYMSMTDSLIVNRICVVNQLIKQAGIRSFSPIRKMFLSFVVHPSTSNANIVPQCDDKILITSVRL